MILLDECAGVGVVCAQLRSVTCEVRDPQRVMDVPSSYSMRAS